MSTLLTLTQTYPAAGETPEQSVTALASPQPTSPQRQRREPVCYSLASAVPAGGIVDLTQAVEAACDATRDPPALRYDRVHGVTRAARDLEAGRYLGRLLLPGASVETGAAVTLQVTIGNVLIERKVETAQPNRAGDGVFVRDETGTVFAAPAATLQPRSPQP